MIAAMESAPPNPVPPKRKLRWFQFSLRSLMAGVALLSLPCGYVGWQYKIVRERKAWCVYQNHLDGKPRQICPAMWRVGDRDSLPLVRRWLGDCELTKIWVRSKTELAPTAALFPEAKLTFDVVPETTDLVPPNVSAARLTELSGLAQLTGLSLSGTRVEDIWLENLKALTQLESLDLGMTNVTDAGLAYIKGLPRLQNLNLFGTDVTDAGVKDLQKALPNCKIEH
jgi:hypothetical protein